LLLVNFHRQNLSARRVADLSARPRPAEVLVDGDKSSIIRKRESYEDLISLEK
jgi:hypothetical protein